MTLSSTISSSLHSLISLRAEISTTFIQRGDLRIALYSIIGFTTLLFIDRMFLQKRRGSSNRQPRGEAFRQPSVERETVGREDQGPGESSVRRARRRGLPPLSLPQPSHVSQERTSGTIQSPRTATPTYTPEHHPSPPAASFDTILENIYLSESPTFERGAVAQEEHNLGPCPPEILVMVFEYVSFQREIPSGYFGLSTLLSLRQVCKEWRAIIDGTPKLWPSLHPPLSEKGCERCVEWYTRTTEGLSRLVKGFDSVVLELPGEGQVLHPGLFNHQLNLAISSFAMKVIIPNRFLEGTAGPSSLLWSAPIPRKPSDGPAMENLRKLEWTMQSHYFANQLPQSFGLPWTSLRRLPWAQLTHITLGMLITLHDCDFILKRALLVEYLTLRDVSGEPLPITNDWTRRNTCSCLHTLKIDSAVSISSLLRQYDLPRLRNVGFDLIGMDSATDLPQITIPWGELTHVSLSCAFTVDLMESLMTQLHAVEVLVLRGQLPDDDAVWTMSHTLRSLKSFTLVPIADAAALRLMSHFIEHVFPASIESINAPLAAGPFKQIIDHPFNSLKVVNLKNHPISPDDFLSFLTCSNSLAKGSFTVHDHYEDPPSPLSPSSVFPPIPSPTTPSFPPPHPIICNISKLELHLDYQSVKANTLLEALNLPKLSSLKFSASRNSSPCHALYQLLVRSRCALSIFSFDCPTAGGTRALELLKLLSPTLEFFEIKNDSGFGETLWKPLTHGGMGASAQCFCPRLDSLVVVRCRDPLSFYKMIESRSNFPNKCKCGLRKLTSVEAFLYDKPEACSEFAKRLEAKNIKCKLDSMPHSDFEH